ncbi:adenylate kinase [Shewanella woodyi]|uniref:adenylate kinase n=1 Tax=Shewanella woodyi TaxID=60961 RepID=UPI003749C746
MRWLGYIELDQLHWLPDWAERPDPEFRALVDKVSAAESWVIDGNYSVARDILWPRATTIIWLNHSFELVLYRAVTRSIHRTLTKKPLFAGNVETFRHSFLSRDSIILWVLFTFHKKRRRYLNLLQFNEFNTINFIELKGQKQVNAFLKES